MAIEFGVGAAPAYWSPSPIDFESPEMASPYSWFVNEPDVMRARSGTGGVLVRGHDVADVAAREA